MNKKTGLIVALFLALATAVLAGKQDFLLANQTGVDIAQIYISAADVDNWEEDLLGADEILPDGNEVRIRFSPDEDADVWDLRVVDEEGTAIDFAGLELSGITRVTLKFEDGEPTAETEAAVSRLDFTLVNKTGVDIAQVFVSASDVDNWEEDLLGAEEILADGGRLNVRFTPGAAAELWDIRVVDEEGTAIDFTGLDLTEISRVTLQFEDEEPVAELK